MYDNLNVIIKNVNPTVQRLGYFLNEKDKKLYSVHTLSSAHYKKKPMADAVMSAYSASELLFSVDYTQSAHTLKIDMSNEHEKYIHCVIYYNMEVGATVPCEPPYADTHTMDADLLAYIADNLRDRGIHELFAEALE